MCRVVASHDAAVVATEEVNVVDVVALCGGSAREPLLEVSADSVEDRDHQGSWLNGVNRVGASTVPGGEIAW